MVEYDCACCYRRAYALRATGFAVIQFMCRFRHRAAGSQKGSWRLFMQIMVRDNNVDQALRALKKKLQREGVYREMKLRRHYEKPSEKRARQRAAAIRRARKLERKRAERDGGVAATTRA